MKLLAGGAAFAVLVGMVTPGIRPPAEPGLVLETEGFAPETVRAEFRFETVDLVATRQAQEAAAAKAPLTYRVDPVRVETGLDAFEERVKALEAKRGAVEQAVRQALLKSSPEQKSEDVISAAVKTVASTLAGQSPFETVSDPALLVAWLMPTPESVPQRDIRESAPQQPARVLGLKPAQTSPMRFDQSDRLAVLGRESLEYVLDAGVLDVAVFGEADRTVATGESQARGLVVVRDKLVPGLPRRSEYTRVDAPTLNAAYRLLHERVREALADAWGEEPDAPVDWTSLQNAAMALAQPSIQTTLVLDEVATESLQEAARSNVGPVMKVIEKNQEIQAGGERWTDQSRSDYKTYMRLKLGGQKQQRSLLAGLAANMILVGLVLLCLMRVLSMLIPESRATAVRDMNLVLLVMCGTLVVGRIVFYFEPTGYVVPMAAGAILLAILLNTRMAVTASLLTAILLSVQYNYSWDLFIVSVAMSFAGVLTIYKVRKRSDMGAAAAKATLVGLLAVVAVTLATDSLLEDAPGRVLRVALNGGMCLFIVPGLLQPLERLFGITTDITLLEYSDLNNEVLSRLAMEVPATYAHSLMLGQLAEAACEAIGANGLLARVSAYYHDIGKLRRPEYFSENQTGFNIHEGLSPRLSARAVASHVTEGVEMAREFHLPRPIIDAIYEHHGTCKISFFYEQAVAQQKHGDVREEDFRYAGPRPQTRETAILMICDAAESAVRALKHPNEERVRELVDRIIASRAEDRQFDECRVTLKDLDTIGEAVTKRVLAGLHRRVPYPESAALEEKKGASNVIPLAGGQDSRSGGQEG